MSNESQSKRQTIFRVCKNKENPYLMMNKTSLRDSRLSLRSKGLHALMLSMPDDWEFHREYLLQYFNDKKDALGAALKELSEFGYITIRNERDEKGKIKKWITEVFEISQDPCVATGSSRNGFTRSGLPRSGKSAPTNNETNTNNDFNNNIICASEHENLASYPEHDICVTPPMSLRSPPLKTTEADINLIFDTLWELYPLKKAKQKAKEALVKALKGKAKPEAENLATDIWRGLNAHLEEHKAKRELEDQGADVWVPQLPHLATWLNQQRWEDDYQSPNDILQAAKQKSGIVDIAQVFRN